MRFGPSGQAGRSGRGEVSLKRMFIAARSGRYFEILTALRALNNTRTTGRKTQFAEAGRAGPLDTHGRGGRVAVGAARVAHPVRRVGLKRREGLRVSREGLPVPGAGGWVRDRIEIDQ